MNLIEELLLEEGPENPPRFDLPVSLEDRGVTSQTEGSPSAASRQWYQQLIWSKATTCKNSIAAKLRSIGRKAEAEILELCHTVYTVAQCRGCSRINKFPNRCDNKHCPECQPRLAHDREKAVEFWVDRVGQPKLVTLTAKNSRDLTRGHVNEFMKWFGNLRRRKFASNWLGGFWSIEVTKEANDWHLHLHALVNARWIDQAELSNVWREITNGLGYIVDVRDARHDDYRRKVKKYAVKGSQLAAWSPTEIATFIDAFDGKRCFGVFGSLYKQRAEFGVWWKQIRKSKPVCECGCCEVYYFTESQFLERDLQPTPQTHSLPPPQPFNHPEFGFSTPTRPPR